MTLEVILGGTDEELETLFNNPLSVSVRSYYRANVDKEGNYFNLVIGIPEDFKYAGLSTLKEWIEADRQYAELKSSKVYCEVCNTAWVRTLTRVNYPHYACAMCRENDETITFGNSIEFDDAEESCMIW